MIGRWPRRLPDLDYVEPEKLREALERAAWVTEVLLDQPVAPRSLEHHLVFQPTKQELLDYPVHQLNWKPRARDDDIQPQLGLVNLKTTHQEVIVSYRLGYQDGELPTVVKQLMALVARYLLTGDTDWDEVLSLTSVGRTLRNREETRRDGEIRKLK